MRQTNRKNPRDGTQKKIVKAPSKEYLELRHHHAVAKGEREMEDLRIRLVGHQVRIAELEQLLDESKVENNRLMRTANDSNEDKDHHDALLSDCPEASTNGKDGKGNKKSTCSVKTLPPETTGVRPVQQRVDQFHVLDWAEKLIDDVKKQMRHEIESSMEKEFEVIRNLQILMERELKGEMRELKQLIMSIPGNVPHKNESTMGADRVVDENQKLFRHQEPSLGDQRPRHTDHPMPRKESITSDTTAETSRASNESSNDVEPTASFPTSEWSPGFSAEDRIPLNAIKQSPYLQDNRTTPPEMGPVAHGLAPAVEIGAAHLPSHFDDKVLQQDQCFSSHHSDQSGETSPAEGEKEYTKLTLGDIMSGTPPLVRGEECARDKNGEERHVEKDMKEAAKPALVNTMGEVPSVIGGQGFTKVDNQSHIEVEDSLLTSAVRILSSVTVRDRKYRLKTYRQCFIAFEAVDLLVESRSVSSRREAVQLCQVMMDRHDLFEHVAGRKKTFADDYLYFRFKQHHLNDILYRDGGIA